MPIVAVTDYGFDVLDIEKGILEPLGCQFASLKTGKDVPQLMALVKDADYVITQFAPVNAEVIGAMQKCRVIVRYGIGVDNVDLAAAAAKKIPVCNVPDYCTNEVADHALAMILEMTRRVSQNAIRVESGSWSLAVPIECMRALKDMTVGVVAFGRIGREVALRLAPVQVPHPGRRPRGGGEADQEGRLYPRLPGRAVRAERSGHPPLPQHGGDPVHDQRADPREDEARRHSWSTSPAARS